MLIYFALDGQRQAAETENDLEIELQSDGEWTSGRTHDALEKILLVAGKTPTDVPPPKASDKLAVDSDALVIAGKMPDDTPIYRVTRRLRPPRIRKAPDPEYPPELTGTHAEATVLLRIVVDSRGEVHSIQVDRTTGDGFEAASAKAVKDWLFEPAALDGKAVPVLVDVEVNFRSAR